MKWSQLSNLPVKWLLSSPLHSLLSRSMMLLTYTGRKSGKQYTTPVEFAEEGNRLLILTLRSRMWWRNLKGGAQVTVRLRGKQRTATATVVLDDPEGLAGAMRLYLSRYPNRAKYFDVTPGQYGEVTAEHVKHIAGDRVAVWLKLA